VPVTKIHWRRAIHSIVAGDGLAHLHPRSKHGGMADIHGEHNGWFRHRNVVGVAAGPKFKEGKYVGPALQVFVRRKLRKRFIDKRHHIPEAIDGRPLGIRSKLKTDVVAVGKPRAQSLIVVDRPALPGYNIGDRSGASGTLGCLVRDRQSDELLGLSCAHVLAPGGASPGASIYVPSFFEAEQSQVLGQAKIGKLASVASIGFDPADGATNVDAATFAPGDEDDVSAVIATLGHEPQGVRSSVNAGLAVRKVGAMSGETHGVVQSTSATVKMRLADSNGTVSEAIFIDQISVTSFTDDGDSGALVLDDACMAVGLHFWAAQGLSVCQPIQRVLDALDCDLA
jgi:hypothetical protein